MKIQDIICVLEQLAAPILQESYDNVGLIIGDKNWDCTGIVCSLDATEAVILEAKSKGCNLVVAHHPIIFSGLKKINGNNYIEKAIIAAIKNDIAIYAIHTNLDNVLYGVNQKMAERLGLINTQILAPKKGLLQKLFTFVPEKQAEKVREAIFTAGAGHIGNYKECSFNATGTGTFKGGENTNPYVGEIGKRHEETEIKVEVIFPNWLEHAVITALKNTHPYEEPAYDLITLNNEFTTIGSGIIGELPEPIEEHLFLQMLKTSFDLQVIRHSPLLAKPIKKVAVCGGAGSFLIKKAANAKADIYITGDIKYHEFFDANNQLVVADIGHWESEQFTVELLMEVLQQNFPTFAVLKSSVRANPVEYFL
jgi:dinuclear metal center YbgI/SA1388 family protein